MSHTQKTSTTETDPSSTGKKPPTPPPDEAAERGEGLESSKYAPQGSGREKAKAGKGREEQVDWSKVPRELIDTTEIGGEDDPGRVGERHLYKKAMRQPGTGGGEGDYGNPYMALKDDETV